MLIFHGAMHQIHSDYDLLFRLFQEGAMFNVSILLISLFLATQAVTAGAAVIPQSNWTVKYADSVELVGEDGAAHNAFDGNPATLWHTEWLNNNPTTPHEIQIDLGLTYDLNGFRYLPRQDGGVNGKIGQYEFYVSNDGINWGDAVATGVFSATTSEKEVLFSQKTGRFIRMRALTEINGKPWSSMAEINVLGTLTSGNQPPVGKIDSPTKDVTISAGESLRFLASGSDYDGNLPLSYRWTFGAGSGVHDSTKEDTGLINFNVAGTYPVTLKVTDSLGLQDPATVSRQIIVRDVPLDLIPYWASVQIPPFPLMPAPSGNPVLSAIDVTDIAASFVADPFLFKEADGQWFLFFEVLNSATNLGNIAVAKSSDGLRWTYDKLVLVEPWHLSYPQVFKYNGSYYMIPETYQKNEIRIYQATNFPYNWQYKATLVSGKDYVDASLLWFNNSWWLFASDTSNSTCYLYYSDNLLSGWTKHPKSPVVITNANAARASGRHFIYDQDRIIRIAGERGGLELVRAFEVDVLSRTEYAEHEIVESPLLKGSGTGWNALDMHQLDEWWTGSEWVCSADGKDSNGILSIGIYTSTTSLAPNGLIVTPSGNVTITAGESVIFSGSGNDPAGNLPLRYRWSFGTGSGVSDSTLKDPGAVRFNIPGTYTVSLTVTNSLGTTDQTPAIIVVTVKSTSTVIPKSGWSLKYTDSQELVGENGAAVNGFDGTTATIWHTQWLTTNPPPPHEIQIDLGLVYSIDGFRYLPRQDTGVNGRIGQYEFYVSSDGLSWDTPVATGSFDNSATEKEVTFTAKSGRYVRLRALTEVNGNPWTSMAELSVIGVIGDVTSPTVSVTAPANSATVSGTVAVTASASDNIAVSRVEFFVNGALSSTTTSSPYSFSWNTKTVANGSYTLFAKAYDAANNVGQSSNVTVTVVNDTTAPTVSLTAPANNATVSGTVAVTASASDNIAVTEVGFFVNGSLSSTATSLPYSFSWNTKTVANGSYTLFAKAYDAANNVGQSSNVIVSVLNDTTAPTVSITAPANNATVSGTVAVTASALDNKGVTKVEFYVKNILVKTDLSAPYSYSWNTRSIAKGIYTISAKAYDAAGNVGQSPTISVTVR